MGRKRRDETSRTRRAWRWVALGVAGMAGAGALALWWASAGPDAAGGPPRLVLDREVVDLGALPFEAPARVVFTLTNSGGGPLRLSGALRVKALKGC